MEKQEFINKIDNFLTNIKLEYVDKYGVVHTVLFDKLLNTTNINLSDLPFDSIKRMFNTVTEFWKITKEYWCQINMTAEKIVKAPTYIYTVKNLDKKPTEDSYIKYSIIRDYSSSFFTTGIVNYKNSTGTTQIVSNAMGYFKKYDKLYVNNTYLKYNDYIFFKKYFNLDITDIDIYYPVKILNKSDFSLFENLFNVSIIEQKTLTTNNNKLIIENNKFKSTTAIVLKKCEGEFYNNIYYNFYKGCSLFNVIKYFIYGLLQYKQLETNSYSNIPLEKIEISKIDENIDKTVSQNMINRIEYDTINEQELFEELQPIPSEDMYANEQHIVLQGIFEDIQKFCNNIEKYIAGAEWVFDKIKFEDLKNIDEKIKYLENILNTYNNQKLDLRGYNSKFVAKKINIVVGDSDNLNYLNLTETENNFLHLEKMLQNNKYPLFAKLNLINQLKQSISLYLNTIKQLADNKQFYNEDSTEPLLPELRNNYDKLAKAVASQEQPLSFGNPSYDSNPNEYPFREERP